MANNKTALKSAYLFTVFGLLPVVILTSCWSHAQNNVSHNQSKQRTQDMISMIETETDPEFIYDYKHSKFVPKEGETLLIMGQTVEDITEYNKQFKTQPTPGGWAAYWGIPEFTGVRKAHKNETGSSQNHQMLVEDFPNTVIQSAMWMVGKWDVAKNAGKGQYDDVIIKYSAWAKAAKRPIYLRIGYEFDGIHNELEPQDYVKAYKHIVDLMRAEGADNVAFVWHSYAARPYKDYALSDWYPGDTYVDWVAISVFGHAYGDVEFGPYCDDVLNFAKTHHKPVMIAESSPINGIDANNNEVWEQWFANYFSFIYKKNIKALSFISTDWSKASIDGISEWKDSRLQNNEQVSKAWFSEINKHRYLKQSPNLFKQLGYKNQ